MSIFLDSIGIFAERQNLFERQLSQAETEEVQRVFDAQTGEFVIEGVNILASARSILLRNEKFVLDKTSFDRLKPGGWLDTKLIDAALIYLNKCEISYMRTHGGNAHALFLPCSVSQTFSPQKNPKKINRIFKGVKNIGIVVNRTKDGRGDHWLLYVAEFDHNAKTFRLFLFDSLQSGTGSFPRLNEMNEILSNIFDGENYALLPQTPTLIDCPQQPNSYDCGIFALANAFYVAADQRYMTERTFDQNVYDRNDGNRFREMLAHTFAETEIIDLSD